MKALGLVVSDKKIFLNCILKTYFWPRDLHMQPIRTIWTILVGDHPRTIPVEFGQITNSGSREDVVLNISLYNSMVGGHPRTIPEFGQIPIRRSR